MPHIHTSPLDPVEIPDVPIHEYVLETAPGYGDRPAVIDGPSGRTYTYEQLPGLVASIAGGLAARGFGKGDVLALVAPNLPEYGLIFHAVSMVGGIVTTVNPTYSAEEFAFQFGDAGAKFAVTIQLFLDNVNQAAEQTDVEEVFVLGGGEGGTDFMALFGEPFTDTVDIDPANDVVVLPYSSGTTGLPKGVMLTHRNLVSNLAQILPVSDMEPGTEAGVAVLPFFHIYGMQVLMNAGLRMGVTGVTVPRFDLEQFLELNQRYGATRSYVVPPIILAMAKHPIVDNYDLSSLRQVVSGAAPLGADLAAAASERMGCEVVQGYGLTETSPVTHLTPPGQYRAGTVGVLVPNTEMRLVDPESGEDQDVGGEGEIWIRGPQVMKGYLNNREASSATVDEDGWLHTGDIGTVDEDGYTSITDRLKELIKYKGFQVPPAELEALLLSNPQIADAAVIGIPDEEAGELPKAFVVPAAGQELTADDVKSFVAEHVAHYKQVREVEFTDEIPKSASGKILRRLLRDEEDGS